MTDKELRKLRRDDLLQILINQQKQIDELNAQLEQDKQALASRDLAIRESGSLAEAALKMNGVFEAAQTAADDYLQQMRKRADELVAEAEARAAEMRQQAENVLNNARTEAERILGDARRNADAFARQAQAASEPQHQDGGEAAGDDADTKRKRRRLWGSKGT
jgi:cell division septum initiation protein DivIVA